MELPAYFNACLLKAGSAGYAHTGYQAGLHWKDDLLHGADEVAAQREPDTVGKCHGRGVRPDPPVLAALPR